jgi:transposase
VAQVNDLSRSLTAFDLISTVVVVVEMSKASWLVSGAVPGVERQPLKKLEPGCDGPVAIDRAVAERGRARWPANQPDRAGL